VNTVKVYHALYLHAGILLCKKPVDACGDGEEAMDIENKGKFTSNGRNTSIDQNQQLFFIIFFIILSLKCIGCFFFIENKLQIKFCLCRL
jgi:hypothetical protein